MTEFNPDRIGIYGGTFDPVHHGHLILARDAVESLGLARLIFVPAAISPHKLARQPGAHAAERLAMLHAAIDGEQQFEIDDCELQRTGPSYTFDTIVALRERLPAGSEFFYLIGEDNVAALDTWYRVEELRELVTFAVFLRNTPSVAVSPTEGHPTLSRRVDISATEIRNRVATGKSIRYLVPREVQTIIDAASLYRLPEKEPNPLPLKN